MTMLTIKQQNIIRIGMFLAAIALIVFLRPADKTQAQFSSRLYSPQQIKAAYHLPATGGTGTIAIIDAESAPTLQRDLDAFDTQFGLPACTEQNGCLTIHYMGGVPIPPNSSDRADLEITLDVEWAHAIAPTAKILLVNARALDSFELDQAIQYAQQQPGVVAVSMSFGAPEQLVGMNFDNHFTNRGIAYFASTGDKGSEVAWPAVVPNVIAVGGTRLMMNGTTFVDETGWGDPNCGGTGGGISAIRIEPDYQSHYGIPNAGGKRGTPDVAAIADPCFGAALVFQGRTTPVGGTSLAAPIWAAISSLQASPISHEALYTNAKTNYATYFRDITKGNNFIGQHCFGFCDATVGYDYVTGLGVPIGFGNQSTGGPTSIPVGPTTPITSMPTATPTPNLSSFPTVTPLPTSTTPQPTPPVCVNNPNHASGNP